MKDFSLPVPQELLNIDVKNRSNLFAWRGQFSPQLIESILHAYCEPETIVLDPFAGSGTVLYEAALYNCSAFGYEVNPAAWCFSKLYEYINITYEQRELILKKLLDRITFEFPSNSPSANIPHEILSEKIAQISDNVSDYGKLLCNALVVSLDIFNHEVNSELIQKKFDGLSQLVRGLPFSTKLIKAELHDARNLPLGDSTIDFIITSPPYINVFNYHQNYRRSVEILGWDLLKVARSEIGSNRANRGNRFITVAQYCQDIFNSLIEMSRVLKSTGRAVLVVGHESNVLGIPFYNAEIVGSMAIQTGLFSKVLHQSRSFTNRFGISIREDIINLQRLSIRQTQGIDTSIPRSVAMSAYKSALPFASDDVKRYLNEAMEKLPEITGTPKFNSSNYREYHTKDNVYMVREGNHSIPQLTDPNLPTPHYDKLKALLKNARLPAADKPRVKKAIERYTQWIATLSKVKPGQKGSVTQLADATNEYKKFIELDLIFDSPGNFLYRQKGQLKLDNTILEEFLPQLFYRGLKLNSAGFQFGPYSTFSGMSFGSSLSDPGTGGHTIIRTKNQDFVLGRRLYMLTSFEKDFVQSEKLESMLGYVCVECKTNLDKTMFQEAVATSRDLKMAVPSSFYFLVCEFLDMTPLSIAPTHIDDVLIVRKSKRLSSNIRQEYTSAKDRKKHRAEYLAFIDSAKFYPDVFQRMIDKVQLAINAANPEVEQVLVDGHF